jgi:hypothetical protein
MKRGRKRQIYVTRSGRLRVKNKKRKLVKLTNAEYKYYRDNDPKVKHIFGDMVE